jgi:hypothetical protein
VRPTHAITVFEHGRTFGSFGTNAKILPAGAAALRHPSTLAVPGMSTSPLAATDVRAPPLSRGYVVPSYERPLSALVVPWPMYVYSQKSTVPPLCEGDARVQA